MNMALQEKIELARRELLDLSLRNPLLNYRTLKKKGLDITDEKSLEIYRLLVEEGKTMAFLSEESKVLPPGKKKKADLSAEKDKNSETVLVSQASNGEGDPVTQANNTEVALVNQANNEEGVASNTEVLPVNQAINSEAVPDTQEDNADAALVEQMNSAEAAPATEAKTEKAPEPSETQPEENPQMQAGQAEAIDTETAHYLELLNKTYSDLKIQTRYNEKDLQERLLNTHLTARTFIEERGVNTLFLALGMLIWEDKDNPGKQYRAPLVLVPVTLSRSNARERFLLTYSEEDIQLNVSLAAKLMTDHHITLNTDTEELDLAEYFKHVREAVVSQPNWRVAEDDIAMGFFSFGKYLMYLDLDSTRWPTDSRFFNNEILQSLLVSGFHEKDSEITETAYIDPYLLPQSTYQIVDADSSQTLAILDINAGRNLVIQGPPGTGKSQTITNIIAESVARGKKVLFVSEKMAALEVVKRRLANVGLGDVCLELHSQKANKKALLAELQATMELGVPKLSDMESKYNEYIQLRGELTGYCVNVNDPVPPSGLSPIKLYGRLMKLAKRIEKTGLQLPTIKIPGIDQLNDIEYEVKALKVKELQKHIQKMGVPKKHPWYGSGLNMVLPAKKEAVQAKVNLMLTSLENFLFVLEEVRALLHVQADKASDVQKAIATLEFYQTKPDIAGFIVTSPRWLTEKQEITKLIADGIRMKEIFARNQSLIMDEFYAQNVLQARQVLAANQGKMLKFLSGDFNKASKLVDGYLKTPQKLTIEKKIAILDDVLEFNRLRQSIDNALPRFQDLFPGHARGHWDTDWAIVNRAAGFILQLHQGIQSGIYSQEILPIIHDLSLMDQALKLLPALKDSLAQFTEACRQFNVEAAMKPGMGANEQTDEFSILQEKIEQWRDGIESIYDIGTFNQFSEEMVKTGLKDLLELAEVWKQAGEFIADVFENERCQALLAKAYRERPALTRFDSTQHRQKIERFNELDCLFMNNNIPRLLYEHWENKPKPGQGQQGQMGVLLREFQKKARHMPIRKLMTKAGHVIQALKPVMMMSPLSIANFIEPGQLSFDMVVFDEASQVRPVEAFGALMRSRQAIVVGDSQQMPPTSFFDKAIDASDIDDEEDYVGDVESILGLFLAQNAPQRMLRWHYRSKHESLISVSNKEFYNNKLVVFPSSTYTTENMGLVFHHLKDAVYDRGNSQTNPEEAKIVAEHVMRHAKEHPELTLGVAAFSMQQMQAIIDQLEIKRRLDPSAESFFQNHKEEPFFVKNLENVQGDERDIIYISIGYGRDKDGALPMNFGPLNRDGGERRLNVLITRARQKCEVFSSITGDDIDLTRTASRGVACLKTFLSYAEKGSLDAPRETDREADSEFELQIYDMLAQKGYTVHQQVGCADFYIDLAVVHPDNSGRYLLGIECDGASYHSARSARDRDRLRQNALERKGWNIYRIWSTDWFRSPNTEIEKLEQYMQKLLQGNAPVKAAQPSEKAPVVVERVDVTLSEGLGSYEAEPYTLYQGRDVNDELIYQPAFLARLIYDILCVESPMHRDELVRRVLGLTGLTRAGTKIQSAFDVAIGHSVRRGIVEQRGDFLYCKGYDIKLRSRSELPAASRKLEYVSPEEIALAIKTVIKTSFGMQQHEIPINAAKALGFSRTTEDMIAKVTFVLQQMEQAQEIKKQGDTYIVA
jgi:very-short-patch-repair endonuclease